MRKYRRLPHGKAPYESHCTVAYHSGKISYTGNDFHLTCRDRNLLGLQAELLGAAALGVNNILTLTGDDPSIGDHPQAHPVYELDSTGS